MSQVDEIKSKLDIASIVAEYVPTLKRNGRNHFGLCPFHSEKTPSFSVNSDLGIYKCFGCGESGDVIKFIQEVENYDFPKALEVLAKKAGVKLKTIYSPADKKKRKEKERILEANTLATKYYHYLLTKHAKGKLALDYTKQRKLKLPVLKKFQIGYAPEGFNNLMNFMIKKGFSKKELVKMGLLVSKGDKIYDKFRDRLMFPIINHQGDIVGFSGRQIKKSDYGPKYLNSPETIVYKKSRVLYGLFQAKEFLRKKNETIIVEGNIDILSSHQSGIGNIVAPLGTALTLEQIKLVRRYVDEIHFALDTDEAGTKALIRSIDLTESEGISSKVLNIGKYQDVDELIRNGGDWDRVSSNAQDTVVFLIEKLSQNYNLTSANGKASFIAEIVDIISKIKNNIKLDHYTKMLSRKTKVSERIIAGELTKISKNEAKTTNKQLQNKIATLISNDYLESYLLALVYNFKDWVDNKLIKRVIKVMTSSSMVNILQSGFAEEKLEIEDKEIFKDIVLLQVEEFEDKTAFKVTINKLITRLKDRKIKEELNFLNVGEEESLQKLKKLADERGKMMRGAS